MSGGSERIASCVRGQHPSNGSANDFCSHLLEVADPLDPVAGSGVDVKGYDLQDPTFFSWFAHQTPSIGIEGQYSLFGTGFASRTGFAPRPRWAAERPGQLGRGSVRPVLPRRGGRRHLRHNVGG